jgi:uncharacterized protein (TIGR02453 family)
METPLNLRPILSFLEDLSTHNNKVWFDENRPAYETARNTFERFVDVLIGNLRASDQLQGVSAKDCVARINRDIRFSKDKSPYKTNLGEMIAPAAGRRRGWATTFPSRRRRSHWSRAGCTCLRRSNWRAFARQSTSKLRGLKS